MIKVLKKRLFIWVYHLYILNPNNKFGMWINIFFSILWCSSQMTSPYFFTSKVHYLLTNDFFINKWPHRSLHNEMINLILVPISRSMDIWITVCIWIKGTQGKDTVSSQKWVVVPCIYPENVCNECVSLDFFVVMQNRLAMAT